MKTTKTEKIINALCEELLEWCYTPEESINEMKHYKKEFRFKPGYNIYAYGNIRPYYYQIRAFFDELNVKVSKNDQVMQARFEHYICLAVDRILSKCAC